MHGVEFRNAPTDGASENGADAPRVVSMERAQALLGDITYREINKKVSRGELVKVKDGRRSLITMASINAHIDSLLEKSASADLVVAA